MRQRRGRRERAPQEGSEPNASQQADEPTTTPQPPFDPGFDPHQSRQPQHGTQSYPPQQYQQPQQPQQPGPYQQPQPRSQPDYGFRPEPGRPPQPGYDSAVPRETSQPFDVWQSYQDRRPPSGQYRQDGGRQDGAWQAPLPGPPGRPEPGYGQWLDYDQRQQPPAAPYPEQQSYPDPSYPDPSYPQQSYPQQDYPRQSYPQQSYPQQDYPQQSYPQRPYPAERPRRPDPYDPLSAPQWPPPADLSPARPPAPNGGPPPAPNGGPPPVPNGGPPYGGPAFSQPPPSTRDPFDFDSFYRPQPAPPQASQPPDVQAHPAPLAAPQATAVPPAGDPPEPGQPGGTVQPPKRRRRRGRLIAILVTVFVLILGAAGAGGGYLLLRTHGTPKQTAASYLSAWRHDNYSAMKQVSLNVPPSGLAKPLTTVKSQLGVKHMTLRLGTVAVTGNSAVAHFTVTDDLASGHVWTYQDKLPLLVSNRRWWVSWSLATIYPGLRPGERFVLSAQWPARGQILAADGTVLSSQAAVNESGSLGLLTGYVGTATAAEAKKLGAPYKKGDLIGVGGIEQQYQNRLAGRPAQIIKLEGPGRKVDATAMKFPAKPGKNVVTSIEMTDQLAASAAVSGAKTNKPIDMVVIQPSTGKVLAVVERPGGFDRALDGIFPPGSTFKIVTASALIKAGLTTSTTVQCPSSVNIDGRTFHNDDNEHYGSISFLTAFAVSCNSVFVEEATQKLDGFSLGEMAKTYGFNATPKLGLPATLGSFKTPTDPVDLAADAFGQGFDLVNPLSEATMAAAVEDGSWRPPLLVTSPKVHQVDKPHPISPAILDALRPMMRAVVTSGTASGVGFGPNVYGKTGTAQYGTGPKLKSHGWFVGYEGDIAFAVIVEGGGYGADSAGPVANAFLRRIS